ncbi:3-oxoacyl-ACP synthase [Mucilaginibacter limnophilus]|uniref:3-oxoacyl-ACP synthase n=1 Tax=Mucilaginibacter limnophilus TaxID=1932778 RepID=A0A3S2UL87_9SPHI|nr:3-oxoacyl-ACP synthase [Mucilaginibacter limnophilus]RVU00468.1 3-oxoacyl-ACP synthase [Mucilaginibacter limnophilus]
MNIDELKQQLYNACQQYVQSRLTAAQEAIDAAQQAANEETKSSAGDKYETGRAMAQLESDRNKAQLNEANKLKVALNNIPLSQTKEAADAGSVVITSNGKFYISISAGTLSINNEAYFAVSLASPVGLQLKGKKAGDSFMLNGRNYLIQAVY